MALPCRNRWTAVGGTAYAQSGVGATLLRATDSIEYNSYYAQDYDERCRERARRSRQSPTPRLYPANPTHRGGRRREARQRVGTLLNPAATSATRRRAFSRTTASTVRITVNGFIDWNPFTWNTSNPSDRFNGLVPGPTAQTNPR